MPEKSVGEQSGDDKPATGRARARKRIQWKPGGESEGIEPEPRIEIEPESIKSNSENDDRLRADKPPHWG